MATPSRRSVVTSALWAPPAVVVAGATPAFATSPEPASSYVMAWDYGARTQQPTTVTAPGAAYAYETKWTPTRASGDVQSGLQVVVERQFVGSVTSVQLGIVTTSGALELRQARRGTATAQSHLDRSRTSFKFVQNGAPRSVRNLTFRVSELDSLYRGTNPGNDPNPDPDVPYAIEQMEISAYPGSGVSPAGVTTSARGSNIAGSGTWANPWRNTGKRYGGFTSPVGTNSPADLQGWFDVRVAGPVTEVTLEHWATNPWTWGGANLLQQYEVRLGALSFDLD